METTVAAAEINPRFAAWPPTEISTDPRALQERKGTMVRLAMSGSKQDIIQTMKKEYVSYPHMLMSYAYTERHYPFLRQNKIGFRTWAMDSGAFTAHQSGKPINLQDYIDFCKFVFETDPRCYEVFSLDVIGDWRQTVKNTEEMWRQGVPAIPCFHYPEPEQLLYDLARDYPKIALGGIAGGTQRRRRLTWFKRVFSRVWPKPMHGFGCTVPEILLELPFHSADSTTWLASPQQFGSWQKFGSKRLRVRDYFNLRAQVDYYLELELQTETKWAKVLGSLNYVPLRKC